jgi:hypothetical protein
VNVDLFSGEIGKCKFILISEIDEQRFIEMDGIDKQDLLNGMD